MSETRRDRLRAELARLRTLASLGARPMGQAIGTTHTTVRRIENGETLPKVQHVRLWLDAIAAADPSLVDGVTRQALLDLAEAVHAETRGWSELLGDKGHVQDEIARRERDATRVRNYQDEIVPGLLQTPEYARAYFTLGRTRDIESAVSARIERQQVLRESGRHYQFLIAERVLTRPVGGVEVLAEQRDRIVSLTRLPSVEVAVLPTAPVLAVPWHNFTLWDTPDGPYALAELLFGQPEVSSPDDLRNADELWERLWSTAVRGDDAVRMIRQLD